MVGGSRVYLATVEGEVSTVADLYLLASQMEAAVRKYVPNIRPSYGSVELQGIGKVEAIDAISQLTPEEREIVPNIVHLTYSDGTTSITLSSFPRLSRDLSFTLKVEGPDQVVVTGLQAKLRGDLERMVHKIEAGRVKVNNATPESESVGQSVEGLGLGQGLTSTITSPSIASVPSDPGPSASKELSASATEHPLASPKAASGFSRIANNPYSVGVGTGVIVWIVTNLPTVANGVSAAWNFLSSQPWAGQVGSALIAFLAGIASMLGSKYIQRRHLSKGSKYPKP